MRSSAELDRASLEINLQAIRDNYDLISRSARQPLGAVVKANAYGLGSIEVAGTLRDIGCDTFFVATVEEAITLRQSDRESRIYIFEGYRPSKRRAYLDYRVSPISNSLAELDSSPKIRGHNRWLHVDTGMNRLGLDASDAKVLMSRGSAIAPDVGIMTHFAHASEPSSNAHKSQLRRIDEILSVFSDETVSLNNSAGCLLSESTSQKLSCSLGRPGIALYGGNPFANRTVDLRSVVRLLAPVRQTRTIRAGESVGYDGVYTATKTTDIATIGIGYADGIPRNISGKAHVNVNGEKAPIIGRVSMDTIIIDLSKIPKRKREAIKVGTPAELIGKTNITDFASWCHTIPYEILTGLGARLHRLYVDQ